MADPTYEAILPRAETPHDIAALVLSTEMAGICLERRRDAAQRHGRATIPASLDEVHELADRLFRLSQIARQYHAHLTQGRRLETPADPAFADVPPTWRDRVRAYWERFARKNLVGEAPADVG